MTHRHPDRQHSKHMLDWADWWTNGADVEPDEPETPWTTTRIRQAAAYAISRVRVQAIPDAFEIAVSAVGLAVAMDPQVDFSDAVAAAQRDVWDAASAATQNAGISRRTGEIGPRVAAYWADWALWSNQPEPGACVDRLALAEVLDALPERHLDTLIRLAFTDSIEQAAETAGISAHAFRIRASRARTAALELLYDDEQPPSLARLPINRRGRNRTCPQGHLIAGDNVYRSFTKGRVREDCKTCQDTRVNARRRGAA